MTAWVAPLGAPPPRRADRWLRFRLWIAARVLRLPVWIELGIVTDDRGSGQ